MIDILYVSGFLLGVGYLLVRTIQGLIDLGFSFEVSAVMGEVTQERQSSETEVSGSVTGGGAGGYVSGSISSKTKRFQEIYLALANGKELRLDFTDFKVPCRAGHRLSIISVRRSSGTREVCAYHNHATDEDVVLDSDLHGALRWPGWERLVGMWGLFGFLMALATAWDDGSLAESGLISTTVVSGVFGLGVGVVAWVILRIGTGMRASARTSAVRAAMRSAILAEQAGS